MKDVIFSHTIPDTLLEPGSHSTHRVGLVATTHSLILRIAQYTHQHLTQGQQGQISIITAGGQNEWMSLILDKEFSK